jgi:hypothetical protein
MAQIEVASVAIGVSVQVQCYGVVIDGQMRGSVKSGETLAFPVVPGIHTVRLETGRNSPAPVKVVVSGTTSLLCQTTARRLFGIFAAGEPETRIAVREREEAPAYVWCGPEEALTRGGLFAAGD